MGRSLGLEVEGSLQAGRGRETKEKLERFWGLCGRH